MDDARTIQTMTRQAMVAEMAAIIPASIHPDEPLIIELLHEAWHRDQYQPLLDDIIEHHRSRHFKSELKTGLLGIFVLFVIGVPCVGVASLIPTWGLI